MRQRKWLWLDLDAMVVELNNIMTLATAMYERYDDFSHGWPHFEIYGTMRGRRQRKPAMLGLDAAMAGLIMAPVATAGGAEVKQLWMDEGGRESLEGFTTYAERRIVEAVQGEEMAALNIGIGWRGLKEEVERFSDNMEFTKLRTKQEGVHPDDVGSRVPYEKGFQFLWRIEREVGRPAFDEFLKKYIATFKFKSIDTETFLEFLKTNIPGIEKKIDLVLWTEGTGIPPDAFEPISSIYTRIVTLANEFKGGRMPGEDEVADWQGQEWELYLKNLPKSVEASQILALDARYRLSESKDYEVKVAFLQLAISSGCSQYQGEVESTLKEVGRLKYLRPLYAALVQGSGRQEEKLFAKRVFAEARDCYHPIAQGVVESIFSKHT